MRTLDGCAFCIDHPNYDLDIPGRIIMETENFRVFPTLGQIVEGYTLIVPKEHYPSFGALPLERFPEFEKLKDEMVRRTTEKYQRPIILEHGGIGQTVSHAHMHLIPFPEDKDIFDDYKKDFPFYETISSTKDLTDIWNTKGQYLYYEINGHKFTFYTPVAPMYGRLVVADALGVPERGNWRTMPRELDDELIEKTIQNLRE